MNLIDTRMNRSVIRNDSLQGRSSLTKDSIELTQDQISTYVQSNPVIPTSAYSSIQRGSCLIRSGEQDLQATDESRLVSIHSPNTSVIRQETHLSCALNNQAYAHDQSYFTDSIS